MASQVSGYIGRINPGNGTNYAIGSTAYGYCQTTAATTEKVVDMTGFTLVTGATIFVKFAYANTAANPTLNVNGTGAKRIYLYGTTSVLPNSSNYMFWNANAVCVFTYDGTGWILGDGEEKTWLLAESCLYHDLWAFGRKSNMPTYEYSLDGTSWTSATLPDGAKKLFACKENITYQIINDTTPYVRLTWLNGNLHSCSATYIAMGCAWSSPHATVSIQLEANTNTGSDGLTNPTWTVLSTHTGISANGSAQFFKLTNAVSGNKGLRFTIWRTSATGTMPVSTLKLLTTRWGDQGGGSELSNPFDWDENANVYPIANNSKSLGTYATRWKDVHSYDFYDYNLTANKFVTVDSSSKLVSKTAKATVPTQSVKLKFNGSSSSISGGSTATGTSGESSANVTGTITIGTGSGTANYTPAGSITNGTISFSGGTSASNLLTSTVAPKSNGTQVVTDASISANTVVVSGTTKYFHPSASGGAVNAASGTQSVLISSTTKKLSASTSATTSTDVSAYTSDTPTYKTLATTSQTNGTAASWQYVFTPIVAGSDDNELTFSWTANTPSSVATTVATGALNNASDSGLISSITFGKTSVSPNNHTHSVALDGSSNSGVDYVASTTGGSASATNHTHTFTQPTISLGSNESSTNGVPYVESVSKNSSAINASMSKEYAATFASQPTLSRTTAVSSIGTPSQGTSTFSGTAVQLTATPNLTAATHTHSIPSLSVSGNVSVSGTITADGTTETFSTGAAGDASVTIVS